MFSRPTDSAVSARRSGNEAEGAVQPAVVDGAGVGHPGLEQSWPSKWLRLSR